MTSALSPSPRAEETAAQQFNKLIEYLKLTDMTTENYQTMMGVLVHCKANTKFYESRRDEALGPAKKTADTIKSWFSPVLGVLSECEDLLKAKATTYLGARQGARLTAAKAGAVPEAPDPEVSGISLRHGWSYKVINPYLLDDEMIMPNEKAIRDHMRETMTEDGPTAAPGVKFFQKVTLAVTAPRLA